MSISHLDFHHCDPDKKDFNISSIPAQSWEKNKTKIIKELDKCQILCSNCHRYIHYRIELAERE